MLNWLRNPKGAFQSMHQSNLALVRERLAAARHDLAGAELRYRAQAVELALADDPKAGSDLRADIVATRQRVDLLVVAVEVAEQREAERKAGAMTRAERARLRALQQHLASIDRAARDVAEAQGAVLRGFRQMVGAANTARSLLPPAMRGNAAGFEQMLTAGTLRMLAEVAAYKASEGGDAAPGASQKPPGLGMVEDRTTGAVPSLAELIGARVTEPVRRHLAASPQKSNPLVAPYASESAPALAVVGGPSPSLDDSRGAAAPIPTGKYLVDLRSYQPEEAAADATDDGPAEPSDNTSQAEPPHPAPRPGRVLDFVGAQNV